jgi:uncharacterized protein (TIGR02246 family)
MQNRIKIFAGVMLVSAVIGGCAKRDTDEKEDSAKAATPAVDAFDKKAAEAEVRAGDQVFFDGVKAKDAEVLASTYSNDAVSMPANSPVVKGHDAIKKFNEDFLKLPQVSMTGATDDVTFSDDGTMAYATGHYSASWADAKGKKVTEDGKYLNVLKKVDGKWKVVADAFSGNAAPKM